MDSQNACSMEFSPLHCFALDPQKTRDVEHEEAMTEQLLRDVGSVPTNPQGHVKV